MPNFNAAYQNYHLTHSNFVEAYKMVNEYVTELYKLPKQFLDETEGTINLLTQKHFTPKSPSANDKSLRIVLDFIDQLDAFTMHTIALFNEHSNHIDQAEVYMRKAVKVQAAVNHKNVGLLATEYNRLIPEVNQLLEGLKTIKIKADETLVWLEQLETEWEVLQQKVKNAA